MFWSLSYIPGTVFTILLDLDGAAAFENVLGLHLQLQRKSYPLWLVVTLHRVHISASPPLTKAWDMPWTNVTAKTPTNHRVGPLFKAYVCYGQGPQEERAG